MIHNPFSFAALRTRASVPSVGGGNGAGDSVSFALERVAIAEQNLRAARDAARAAARQAGRSTSGLFAECAFIGRSTGERWRDEAWSSGERSGLTRMADHLSRAFGADPAAERAAVKAQLAREAPARAATGSARRQLLRDSGFLAALADGDHDAAAEIYRRITPGTSKAGAILRAGKRARMSADAAGEVTDPPRGSVADQIIAAGRKRRGEA
jgi:hypothetical protein